MTQLSQFDGDKSWITDDEIPDPTPLPTPFTYHLIVRPVALKKKQGSLLLPDSVVDDAQYLTNVGRVVSMGPTAFIDPDAVNKGNNNPHGKFGTKPPVKVGDYVVWGKHRGVKIKVKGVSLVVLNDDELVLRVDDPNDLNPYDNLSKMTKYRS